MKCPNCGAENDAANSFCEQCGTQLTADAPGAQITIADAPTAGLRNMRELWRTSAAGTGLLRRVRRSASGCCCHGYSAGEHANKWSAISRC